MDMRKRYALALLLFIVHPRVLLAACGVDRWPVKTVTDAHASQVRTSVVPTTIEALRALPAPRPLPQNGRVTPVETTIYSVSTTIVAYRLTPESDIHIVLADETGRTVIARIPAVACAQGSRFLSEIAAARADFDRKYQATEAFTEVRQPVEIQGLGFFDFFQGQRGIAPNAIAVHPVTRIDFRPLFPPQPPPQPVRRRAVGGAGQRVCPRATLSITTSRGSACSGEAVTVSWQASDPAASVTIDGIGAFLTSSGSRAVSIGSSTAFSGRASTSCGLGDESVAVVSLTNAATASLSGPFSLSLGSSGTISVAMSGASSWTLTSSLGNSLSPSSGTTNRTVTYTANRTGIDSVTLLTSGGGCGSVTKSITISVTSPPSTGGLRCCDGTRSPTCFDCGNKRGCCSSHGGVCGCP